MEILKLFFMMFFIFIILYNQNIQVNQREFVYKLNELFKEYRNILDYEIELYKHNLNIINDEYNNNINDLLYYHEIINTQNNIINNYKIEVNNLKKNITQLKYIHLLVNKSLF